MSGFAWSQVQQKVYSKKVKKILDCHTSNEGNSFGSHNMSTWAIQILKFNQLANDCGLPQ